MNVVIVSTKQALTLLYAPLYREAHCIQLKPIAAPPFVHIQRMTFILLYKQLIVNKYTGRK